MKESKGHTLSIPSPAGHARSGRATRLERALVRRMLILLGDPPFAVELWDGEIVAPSTAGELKARVQVRDRAALYGLLRHPDLHFGDAYATGRIEIQGDLVEFLDVAYRHLAAAHSKGWLWRLSRRLGRPRRNTLTGSRRNIHHHYDLGNDFYRLWLDKEMVYTCAYFPDPEMTLEAAQLAKMDHVCRKLRLRPGETVVEAGCGWGSLARHMARYYGVSVQAYNISEEQVRYARERVRAEGLEDRVQYHLADYRQIDGQYDVFVSIGMLEHVGPANYRELGRVVDRALRPDGRGLIHSIGRNQPGPMNPWIEKRIFPGAQPPSLGQMTAVFEPYDLSVLDVENLRLHYAKTLEHWLGRFERVLEEVKARYDEFFARAWRLYLSGSIAAFTTSSLQLFQVLFARPRNNDLPWSRAHLYRVDD